MPIILKGNVAVVAIVLTPSAEFETPVLSLPVRADVPKDAFAKTAVKAVARSVKDASLATLKICMGLSATNAFTGKFVSTLTELAPGQ